MVRGNGKTRHYTLHDALRLPPWVFPFDGSDDVPIFPLNAKSKATGEGETASGGTRGRPHPATVAKGGREIAVSLLSGHAIEGPTFFVRTCHRRIAALLKVRPA